ncbi:arginine/serine-rich protein PNISR [Drosophila subobscura]|uniref:arginine/serine-rich protein PNISR n=1 Tax=Drosophila subobscura TaxID=7241 RepID=UPI00155A84A3|nr:arginine/serine-rich protein PNISR [Drosophila subobscura]
MADIDCEPFNPFNVGPPNSGQRMEFKIPTSPTYPPPVFAILPQDKQGYIKRSISHLKLGHSKIGEVAVSKAINEEMAAAKQQAAALDDEQRFDAGGISKLRLPNSKSSMDSTSKGQSKVSVETLMPVRSQRQAKSRSTSGSSVSAEASEVSRSSASKRSKKSQSSIASKRSQSSSPSKSSAAASLGRTLSRASSKFNPPSTTASSVTLTSKLATEHAKVESVKASSSKEMSKLSLKSMTGKKSSGTLSARSRASKTIEKPTETASDNLSQHSVQSKTKDAVLKSKKNESTATLKSKAAPSKASLKAKVKPANQMKSVKTLAEETSLIDQAAKFTERLKAGDEENFRRYSSLMNNYSRRVPEKLFREDRMSFWFQDAVLS